MWSRSAALVTLSASATAMNALMCRKSIAGGFYTNSVYLRIERCIGQLRSSERGYPGQSHGVAA